MSTRTPGETSAQPTGDPELARKQQIVDRIIDYFSTQESLAGQPEVRVDQSAVSLWLKRGRIPSERQDQILAASRRLHAAGEKERALSPWEFFYLPDEVDAHGNPLP